MTTTESEGNLVRQAQQTMLDFVDEQLTGVAHSIAGRRFGVGPYDLDASGKDKDRQDAYRSIRELFTETPTADQEAAGVAAYLQERCEHVWWYPEETRAPFIVFAQRQYHFEFRPPDGPSPFYKGWVAYTADDLGLPANEIEGLMPWDEFKDLPTGEGSRRIRLYLGLHNDE